MGQKRSSAGGKGGNQKQGQQQPRPVPAQAATAPPPVAAPVPEGANNPTVMMRAPTDAELGLAPPPSSLPPPPSSPPPPEAPLAPPPEAIPATVKSPLSKAAAVVAGTSAHLATAPAVITDDDGGSDREEGAPQQVAERHHTRPFASIDVEALLAARDEAEQLRQGAEEQAYKVRADAEEEAARIVASAEASRREAESLAMQLRADAEMHRSQTERVLEGSRSELLVEAAESRRALEQELARLREQVLTEAVAQRDALLADPVAAVDRARDALLAATERLERTVPAAPPRRVTSEVSTIGGVGGGGESPWRRRLMFFERIKLAALFLLVVMIGAVLLQVADLRATIETQRLEIEGLRDRLPPANGPRAAALLDRDKIEPPAPVPAPPPPPVAAVPPVAVAAAAEPSPAAVPPPVYPKPGMPAVVPPVAPPVPAPVAPPAADDATPLTDEERAESDKLLGGRAAADWLKKRATISARRSAKAGKIDPDQLATTLAAIDKHKFGPLTHDELDDLRKVRRAQQTMLACKLIDDGGLDLQLGSGTRNTLKEVASGAAFCKGTPADKAALAQLQADLGAPAWQQFLDDEKALSIARAASH